MPTAVGAILCVTGPSERMAEIQVKKMAKNRGPGFANRLFHLVIFLSDF
jgi:hypothetical protein